VEIVDVVVLAPVFADEPHPAVPSAVAKATAATAADRLVLNRLDPCFTVPPIS
jgi:hypothetical protein